VRPLLHQLAALEHQNPIRHPHRGEAIEIAARQGVAAPRFALKDPSIDLAPGTCSVAQPRFAEQRL
jgi:hypothetical protein